MKNAIDSGNTLLYTNGGGATITAGTLVKASHTLGFAIADIAVGATGALRITGSGTAPKVPGAVFPAGAKVLWDASAGAFDDADATPASGDVMGGAIARTAGTNGQLTCEVILTYGNTTLTA